MGRDKPGAQRSVEEAFIVAEKSKKSAPGAPSEGTRENLVRFREFGYAVERGELAARGAG